MTTLLLSTLMLCVTAGPSGQIAFVAGPDEPSRAVHVMDLADRVLRRIGPGAFDGPPVWSPAGDRLAFTSRRGDQLEIFVVNADGSGGRFLEHYSSHTWNRLPRWSPDGRFLAYAAGTALDQRVVVHDTDTGAEFAWGGDAPLTCPIWVNNPMLLWGLQDELEYAADRKGGEKARVLLELLTRIIARATHDLDPIDPTSLTGSEWGWNGAVLRFSSKGILHVDGAQAGSWTYSASALSLNALDIPSTLEIRDSHLFAPGGQALARLTGLPPLLAVGLVADAPGRIDGRLSTEIFLVTPTEVLPLPEMVMPSAGAYVEWGLEPSPNGKALAIESNDGGDREIFVLTRKGAFDISNHREADWNPVWSPDGDWLGFESFRDGRRGIYRTNPDTALVFPLAFSPDYDCWAPSWSPDGQWICFVSNRDGNPDLFVVDRDGKQFEPVLAGPDLAYAPAWRPTGKHVP